MFQRVREFHRVFGHPIALSPLLPDRSVRDLRVRLLQEEIDEFCIACDEADMIEMADGLADIAVIIAGTMVAYGVVPGDGRFESPYPDGMKPILASDYRTVFPLILVRTFHLYSAAELNDDLEAIKSVLMMMMLDVCGIAMNLGIPLNAVFAEVHRSNMAKLLPDGSVLRRADNKILKPDGWTPPDIRQVLATWSQAA